MRATGGPSVRTGTAAAASTVGTHNGNGGHHKGERGGEGESPQGHGGENTAERSESRPKSGTGIYA